MSGVIGAAEAREGRYWETEARGCVIGAVEALRGGIGAAEAAPVRGGTGGSTVNQYVLGLVTACDGLSPFVTSRFVTSRFVTSRLVSVCER